MINLRSPRVIFILAFLALLLLVPCAALAGSVTSLSVGGIDVLANPGQPGDDVYFDAATDTLYLTNANVAGIAGKGDALNIVLAGDSTVSTTENTAVNLTASAASGPAELTISGGGSLTATGLYYGLSARDIVIKSGTIHIVGVSFAGIYPSNSLTIQGGATTIDSFATTYTLAYGVYARGGLFRMTGGSLDIDNLHNTGHGVSAAEIEVTGGRIESFGVLCGMEATKADGKLSLKGGQLSIGSRDANPLYAMGDLLVSGGRLEVATEALGEPVISVRGNIRMTGGRVTAQSTNPTDPGNAVLCRKDISITGGALTAIGGRIGVSSLCDLDIGGTATVHAEGTTNALQCGLPPYQIRIGGQEYTSTDTTVNIVNGELVTFIVPVTDITDLPLVATTGESLTLTGTIAPPNATGKTILWTIEDEGGTGASIEEGVLLTRASGTLMLKATVPSGISETQDFEKTFNIAVMDRAATPVASPAGGSYSGAQRVTLTCATPGATIYYTTDGNDPTAASAAYASPIAVRASITLKAAAIKQGMTDSRIMSEVYAITYPPAPPVAPAITTAALPNGVTTVAYNQPLSATGDAPISWSLESGALPDGLNLLSGGIITGTPTRAGAFSFTVRASNAGGSNTRALTITIAEKGIPLTRLAVEPDSGSLVVGETLQLRPRFTPANASNQNVSWTCAQSDVATVDVNGLVAAIGVGKVEIVAISEDGGHRAICRVTVTEPETLELNVNMLAIGKGKKLKLSGLTGFAGSWESMDLGVAAVGKTGVLTAKQVGSTALRFTVGLAQKGATFMGKALMVGDTVSIDLHVVKKAQAVKKLKVTPKKLILGIGETASPAVTLSPKSPAYPQVFWRSQDGKIASVDSSGFITGVSSGDTKIIATATSGLSQTISVTVSDKLREITLSDAKKKLKVGETYQLSLKSHAPATLPAPALSWSSGKTSVATVDENGLVAAVGKGKATITATAAGGVKAICKITVR